MNQMDKFDNLTDTVTSADGTIIGYRKIGKGPGLVILHAGMLASQHFMHLAELLADMYTVYIPDRRGRGLSGPEGDNYSIEKEIEDIDAILQKSGATLVFGYSSGGLLALEAALELPIEKLAVYDPAVSINGSVPTEWLPSFDQAIANNDLQNAAFIILQGTHLFDPENFVNPSNKSDKSREKNMFQEILNLVPTFKMDISWVIQLDSKYERYKNIMIDTLLLGGEKSPKYLRDALIVLEKTIPNAKHIELIGLDHGASTAKPEIIAKKLKNFFK